MRRRGPDHRSHTLSQVLEDGVQIRAADMLGANDLMMRVYAAMAQKEREVISERRLGGDRGYRPATGPDAQAAAQARREAAERAAHRLSLEIEAARADGVHHVTALARLLTERAVPTLHGSTRWTHTTVARVLARSATA